MQVGSLHRVTYTRCCIDTTDSPDDEHKVDRNMYRIEINIYRKGIGRQVGYLLELFIVSFAKYHQCTQIENTNHEVCSTHGRDGETVVTKFYFNSLEERDLSEGLYAVRAIP
jgi:hypothetical protein